MSISAGMTSAITNPLHSEVMQAVRGADVMMGKDPDCASWIKAYREQARMEKINLDLEGVIAGALDKELVS